MFDKKAWSDYLYNKLPTTITNRFPQPKPTMTKEEIEEEDNRRAAVRTKIYNDKSKAEYLKTEKQNEQANLYENATNAANTLLHARGSNNNSILHESDLKSLREVEKKNRDVSPTRKGLNTLSDFLPETRITVTDRLNAVVQAIITEITPLLIEICYANVIIISYYRSLMSDAIIDTNQKVLNFKNTLLFKTNEKVVNFKNKFRHFALDISKYKIIYTTTNNDDKELSFLFDNQNYKNLYENCNGFLDAIKNPEKTGKTIISPVPKEVIKICTNVITQFKQLEIDRKDIIDPIIDIKHYYDQSIQNIRIVIPKLMEVMSLNPTFLLQNISNLIINILNQEYEDTKSRNPITLKYHTYKCDSTKCINLRATTVNNLFIIPYDKNITELWIDDFTVDKFTRDGKIINDIYDYYPFSSILGSDMLLIKYGGKSNKSNKSNKSKKSKKSNKSKKSRK